jgi:hypothetical protein
VGPLITDLHSTFCSQFDIRKAARNHRSVLRRFWNDASGRKHVSRRDHVNRSARAPLCSPNGQCGIHRLSGNCTTTRSIKSVATSFYLPTVERAGAHASVLTLQLFVKPAQKQVHAAQQHAFAVYYPPLEHNSNSRIRSDKRGAVTAKFSSAANACSCSAGGSGRLQPPEEAPQIRWASAPGPLSRWRVSSVSGLDFWSVNVPNSGTNRRIYFKKVSVTCCPAVF